MKLGLIAVFTAILRSSGEGGLMVGNAETHEGTPIL